MLVRRTVKTILLAMVLTLTISTTVMAEAGGGFSGGFKGAGGGDAQHIILRALVGVNLTDAQKTAIANILKGYKD
ncbi:secreted protein, partial [Candidatus Magnetobacterium bavaricum]